MANIRTIDYEGQKAAIGGYGPTGWILWSGSVADCTSSGGADTIYDGIGFEFIGSATSYIRFAHIVGSSSEIDIRADEFFVGQPSTQFISASAGLIEISSSNFHLTSGGEITASAGNIAGWTIESTKLSSGTDSDFVGLIPGLGIQLGDSTFADAPFTVNTAGALKAVSGEIASFTISNNTLGTTGYSGTTSGVALTAGAQPSIIARKDESNYIQQYYDSVTDWGLRGYAASTALFQLGSTNQIAGWKFDSSKIISNLGSNSTTSPGIVINSNGTIETDPFISGLTANAVGWQIRADGRAEFENAVIRGTLSTAVFEKDTISVVGGQVMVANAAKIDTTNPRFIDYPFLHNTNGDPLNYSGEELPAANQIGKYTGPFNPGGVYRTTDWVSNEPHQSDLWWKFTNAAAGTHTFTFTIGTVSSTSDPTKEFRLTFYADKGTFGSGLTFAMKRLGYTPGYSGNYAYTGTSGSWNGAAESISTSHTCIDGLNTYYFKGDSITTGHNILFITPSTGANLSAYVRDFHITEVSSSLTVDNAGGFAPGEIVVAKSTDQGPDGREGFVREYMRIQSSSLGATETPASGTLDLSSTTISSGTVFHVTASKNYTFTGVASATVDVPANNDYKYIVGANKSDSIRNIKNKIMEECLDAFAMVTGSTEGANDQLYLLSHGVGTDGNSYGIRQGSTTVTLSGAVDRVKPTLVVERNLDALVSGNGMGYSIQRIRDGQSVASQGKVGTGYILMNAQPTDDNSPYIDIVQRNSAGVGTEQHTENSQHSVFGDVKTQVRIGDLGGITDYTFSDGVSGYGIYTGNGYFKGKIEVTNPQGASMEHNFGGPSGSVISETELIADNDLVGPQWYNTQHTRHIVENGGLFVSGSQDAFWTSELRSKQTFNRVDDHTFQSDFTTVNTTNNQQMLGLGDTGTPSGTSGGNFSNTAHAIYIDGTGIKVYEGSNSMNSGTNIYSSVSANNRFRIIIKPHVDSKGAVYKLYKHPALITPVAIFDSKTEANAKQDLVLDAGVWSYRGDSERTFFENIKILAPGQMTTTIEGDKITTGKIQSTNLTTTAGSIFNLNDGTFKLGGTDSTTNKLEWDGTSLTVRGIIQINAGSTFNGNTIATLATLSISSNTNVFAFDDASDTTPSPATAAITVNQANQADNLVVGDISVTNCTISNFSFTQVTAVGTGYATMTATPTGTYPVSIEVNNDGLSDSITMQRINGGTGGVDGSNGTDGSDGADGRVVNLTMSDQAFEYNTSGLVPSPTTATITATALNTTGTVKYEFFLNDVSDQSLSTTPTYPYTPQTSFANMPDKIEVQITDNGDDTTIQARDQITAQGLKAGGDAITLSLSNEAHTLPTTTAGVVTYDGSGTDINVWIGTTQLAYGTGNEQFTVSVASATGITAASGGDVTTVSTYTRRYADHGSMTATNANIVYTITAVNAAGVSVVLTKTQTFAKSVQGVSGNDGLAGAAADDTINTAAVFAYKRFAQGVSTNQPATARDWNFANAAFTNTDLGNSWTPTIPTGADNLFMCTAIASGTGTTDEVAVADWSTAQQLGAAGVPGEPAFTKTFPYDDFDTNGGAAGQSRYTFQTTYDASSAYGSNTYQNTNLSAAGAVQIHNLDYDGTDHSTYYDSLVVGDSMTFYVSADRWYHYTINAIDSSPPSGRRNWGLDFVSENITLSGGETVLSTSATQPSNNFRFQKAVDGTVGTNGINTAVVYAYQRSSTAITAEPSTTRTWTFASATWGNNDLGGGWTGTIPTGTLNLYVSSAVASSNTATASVTATTDWSTPQLLASNGTDGLDGSNGTDGSEGADARAVSLTMVTQAFEYNTSGTTPLPAGSTTVTATALNTTGTVKYEFFLNDVSDQASSTSPTYLYTPQSSFANMPDKIEVQITDSGTTDIKARDMITAQGLKEGSDAITVNLSNEAHTLPVDILGNVDNAGSGTNITVFIGTTQLNYGTGNNEFQVTTSATNVTAGSAGTSNYNVRGYGLVTNFTSPASITFTITAKNAAGVSTTILKTQSLTASQEGATGTDGDGVQFAYLDNNSSSVPSTPTAIGTGGWTASPTGVTISNQYEWVSQRTSTNGTFGSFSTPALFTNYAEDGTSGSGFDFLAQNVNALPTPAVAGLFMGENALGFHRIPADNSAGFNAVIGDFASYMDSSGNFYLNGDGTGGSLAWNDAANTLDITGTINVANPGDFADPDTASPNFPTENLLAYYPLDKLHVNDSGGDNVLMILDESYNPNRPQTNNSINGATAPYHSDDVTSGSPVLATNGFTDGSSYAPNSPLTSAMRFDGVDDRVKINSLAGAMYDNMDISVSFWMFHAGGNEECPFHFADGGSNDLNIFLNADSQNNRIKVHVNGTAYIYDEPIEWTNTWKHVALTLQNGASDSSTMKFYLNGLLRKTWTSVQDTGAFGDIDEAVIGLDLDGANFGTPGNWFEGAMGQFRVYDSVLTQANVTALYHNANGQQPQKFITFKDDFGGPEGVTKATQAVSANRWKTGGSTATIEQVDGVFKMKSTGTSAWDAAIRSHKVFNRKDCDTLVCDITILDIEIGTPYEPRMMIGWGDANSVVSNGYSTNAHAVYFSENSIKVYEDTANGGIVLTSAVADGDKFRVEITPNKDSGFHGRIYRFTDLTTTIATWNTHGESFANIHESLDVGVWSLHDTNTFQIDQIYVESKDGVGSTIIKGDSITTGKIQSTNFSTTAGSELDLNVGEIVMGGSTAPDFQVTAAGFVSAKALRTIPLTLTSTNKDDYCVSSTTAQSTTVTTIYLDGSVDLGVVGTAGDYPDRVFTHVILDLDCFHRPSGGGTVNGDVGAIVNIVPPILTGGASVNIKLEIAADAEVDLCIENNNVTTAFGYTYASAVTAYQVPAVP